jgi:hypothetical protein
MNEVIESPHPTWGTRALAAGTENASMGGPSHRCQTTGARSAVPVAGGLQDQASPLAVGDVASSLLAVAQAPEAMRRFLSGHGYSQGFGVVPRTGARCQDRLKSGPLLPVENWSTQMR